MPLGLVERGHHENPRYESLAHIRPTVDCGPPKALARPPRPPASFTARKEAQVEAAVNDIKMIENIAREMARPPSLSVLERKGPMSLNTNQRRKELQRIDLENQRLLKRLESQKSTYSRRDQKSSYEQSRRHARLARARGRAKICQATCRRCANCSFHSSYNLGTDRTFLLMWIPKLGC
ncbi:CFAP97D1 [Symbiodinium sp. CCMP2592]|nr:CFAP97D1 [Symbiodinium sp. CCMP2592]